MSLNIDERKLSVHKIKRGDKIYKQYRLTIPSQFAEEHKTDKVYLIADTIGLFVPDQATLLRIISIYPDIRELVLRGEKDEELVRLFNMWEKLSDEQKKDLVDRLVKTVEEDN